MRSTSGPVQPLDDTPMLRGAANPHISLSQKTILIYAYARK
jgi:hypothetical protein